jgi:biotin synthase
MLPEIENFGELGILDARDETTLMTAPAVSSIWTTDAARSLYRLPFNDLLFKAQSIHRQQFDPNRVQLSKLLNIKTEG